MRRGFTFTELIIVTGMLSLLVGLGSHSMLTWRSQADIQSTHNIISADILSQQTRSMTGACQNTGDCGVYFENNRYILFDGSIYVPGDPSNFEIPLEVNFSFTSIDLPGDQLVFEKESGEIANYDSLNSQIVLSEINSGKSVNYQWNKYGVDISP